MRASRAGGRNVIGLTSGPRRTRVVSAAATVRATQHSSDSRSLDDSDRKWSDSQSDSKPSRSTAATMRRQRSQVRPSSVSTSTPSFIYASVSACPTLGRLLSSADSTRVEPEFEFTVSSICRHRWSRPPGTRDSAYWSVAPRPVASRRRPAGAGNARQGLDAELVQAAATVSIAGMVNGDVDFSMSLGSLARAAAKGLPVRVLEESGTAPQLYLVARPEIRSLADLRGKVLSPISMGGTNSQTATLLLRKHGVDPQSVQLLAGGDAPRQLEMLRQGQIDAALISPPYPLVAQREGYPLLANAQEEIALAFTGITASLDTLAQRGDLVRRTIRAEIEALQYLHADREGTIRLMEQRFNSEPDLAAAAYDQIIGAFTTDGTVSREGVDNVMALDKEEGEIPDSAQFEDVVDLRPLQDVQRAMGLAR